MRTFKSQRMQRLCEEAQGFMAQLNPSSHTPPSSIDIDPFTITGGAVAQLLAMLHNRNVRRISVFIILS